MRRTRRMALVGLLGSLALVWAASAGMIWKAASTPTATRDAKFASAERLIFFRLEPGESLEVPLPSTAEAFRLLTHLVLPPGTEYAPESQYVYGVQVRLLGADGGVLLERPLFTRTRQSKAQKVDGLWLQESAFSVNPEVQLTDGREFLVELSPEVRARAQRLELRHPGTQGALLVRAYARLAPGASLLSGPRTAARKSAEARAVRASFLPWEKLAVEGPQQVDAPWERLSPEGEAGQDYRTEPVYRTDFRLPLVEVAEAAQERLEPGRGAAVNVSGPVSLVLWLWAERQLPPGEEPGWVSLQVLSADGKSQSWEVPAPRDFEPVAHALELPAGASTLSLRNAAAQELRFTVEGPAQGWLAPDGVRPSLAALRVAYLPDARRSEAWAAGPGCPVLELDVAAVDAAARLLRVDARALGVQAAKDGGGELTLTMLDAHGRPLAERRLALPADAAPFEGADLPPMPEGQLPCGPPAAGAPAAQLVEVSNRPVPVAQPATARLFLPAGTHRVRVTTTRPAAVTLASFLQATRGAVYGAPYRDVALEGMRWRSAPVEARNWHPLRPANHPALAAAGAQLELVSQVRLEPETPLGPPRPPTGDAVSLVPAGVPASRELLEPAGEGPEDPTRALSSLLSPGQPVRVSFDARTPTRPELRLGLADGAALGGGARLLIDGKPVHEWVLRTTRARELLAPVPAGVHEVLLESQVPGLTAVLNRPPEEGGGLRARTVYRLEGQGLRVAVRKPGPGALTLNMVLYAPTPAGTTAPRVTVQLDGGAPPRRGGVLLPRLTRAVRPLPLPASARPPATVPGQPGESWYPHPVPIRLGEDLAPGVHWVQVTPVGEGPLWARFFVFGEEPEEEPQQWNRPGWELEDAP